MRSRGRPHRHLPAAPYRPDRGLARGLPGRGEGYELLPGSREGRDRLRVRSWGVRLSLRLILDTEAAGRVWRASLILEPPPAVADHGWVATLVLPEGSQAVELEAVGFAGVLCGTVPGLVHPPGRAVAWGCLRFPVWSGKIKK